MANFVQDYASTDLNSPPISGQINSLPVALDAVLANGYGFNGVSITGITRAGTTATATCAAIDILRMKTGMIVTVSGATGGDAALYNGTFSITVASTTTFTYTMSGTPVASPATGTLLASALLKITTLVRVGTVVTATLLNTNSTLRTGNRVLIAGAVETDYNGVVQITVLSGTSFSYVIATSPSTPATGTITYTKAGLGWEIAFTAVGKRSYRSPDVTSNRFYLRVDDSATTTSATVRAYEVMTDVDTGTGPFPTVAQIATPLWLKSTTADTTQRAWTIIGDDKAMYYIIGTGVVSAPFGFGHINSFKPGDGYNSFMAICTAAPAAGFLAGLNMGSLWGSGGGNGMLYLARGHAQVGGASATMAFDGRITSATAIPLGGVYPGIPYPNGPDSGLWVTPLFICDYSGSNDMKRGVFPGLYVHMHGSIPHAQYDLSTGVIGLTGVTLMAITIQTYASSSPVTGQLHFDIAGPW